MERLFLFLFVLLQANADFCGALLPYLIWGFRIEFRALVFAIQTINIAFVITVFVGSTYGIQCALKGQLLWFDQGLFFTATPYLIVFGIAAVLNCTRVRRITGRLAWLTMAWWAYQGCFFFLYFLNKDIPAGRWPNQIQLNLTAGVGLVVIHYILYRPWSSLWLRIPLRTLWLTSIICHGVMLILFFQKRLDVVTPPIYLLAWLTTCLMWPALHALTRGLRQRETQ